MKSFSFFIESNKKRNSEVVKELPVHGSHATGEAKPNPPASKVNLGNKGKVVSEGQITHETGGASETWVSRINDHTIDKEHEALTDHYALHHTAGHLSPDHYGHLREYTRDSSEVNGHLVHHYDEKTPLHGPISPHTHLERMAKHIQEVTKAHKAPHTIHVYSGTGFDPRKYGHNGDRLHLPAFTSASLRRDKASSFARENPTTPNLREKHILHIRVKKGQHGVYLGDHSRHPNEREFILPHGTKLKRTHPPSVFHDQDWSGNHHRTFIHHYEVDDDHHD